MAQQSSLVGDHLAALLKEPSMAETLAKLGVAVANLPTVSNQPKQKKGHACPVSPTLSVSPAFSSSDDAPLTTNAIETPARAPGQTKQEPEDATVTVQGSKGESPSSGPKRGGEEQDAMVGQDRYKAEDVHTVVRHENTTQVTHTGEQLPTQLIRKWPSTLMRLIGSEPLDDDWLPVMERIRTHPHEITIQGKNGGQSALHAACVRYPPVHVVRAQLEARPAVALLQNYSGETPLHLASYSASEEVQELLVEMAPGAVALTDQYGDTPLHFAARSGATLRLMEKMVRAAPQCISRPNQRGVTPLWLLPRSYLEADDMEEILEDTEDYRHDWDLLTLFLKYSYEGHTVELPRRDVTAGLEEIDVGARRYDWVVHAAAATPSCPREVLVFLCRLFPEQALVYNERGFTPLLIAAQTPEMEEPEGWDETEDGFREPVEAAECELQNQEDEVGEEETALPAGGDSDFLARVIQEGNGVDTSAAAAGGGTSKGKDQTAVDVLLEWSPRSATVADRNGGRLPLAHALASGRSWKTVRRLIAASPRALEARDPPTGLCMFQLAAMGSPELDTVYSIVRSLPQLIGRGSSATSLVRERESGSPAVCGELPAKRPRINGKRTY